MTPWGPNGAEAPDAVLAANDVEGRHSRRCWIHVFACDLQLGAGLRCELYQQGIGYEARPGIVDASLSLKSWLEICYRLCAWQERETGEHQRNEKELNYRFESN